MEVISVVPEPPVPPPPPVPPDTVKVALPVISPVNPFMLAVIVAEPAASPVAAPELLTVATLIALDDQLTSLVMSFVTGG